MPYNTSELSQRKTFLSPQFIRTVRKIQSPKFDKQKADEQHLKRKIIYEKKLATYDQYNSILSAKVQKQISSLSSKNSSHIEPQKTLSKHQENKPKKQNKKHPDTQSRLIQCPQTAKEEQECLTSMRQKNRKLHQRNAQLKSYLNEINSGVSELQCIFQQVEETYNSFNQIKPQQFKGLWLMEDQQDDQNIDSQKQTKDTVDFDFDYDRTLSFKNLLNPNQISRKTKINHVDVKCQATKMGNKIATIDLLENKFKQILQKISKRQMFELQIDSQITELNALEKEIDKLRQTQANRTLKKSISDQNLSQVSKNPIDLPRMHQDSGKFKSLEKILS